MGAQIRNVLIVTAVVAFWVLLLVDLINWLRGLPIDWASLPARLPACLLWACLIIAVVYGCWRGWFRLVSSTRRGVGYKRTRKWRIAKVGLKPEKPE